MNNAELIKALRTCADHNAVGDKCYGECPYNGNYNECVDQMIIDAANALEEMSNDIEKHYIPLLESWQKRAQSRLLKIQEMKKETEELLSETANVVKINERLKAQLPKEGEWIEHRTWGFSYASPLITNYHCSICDHEESHNKYHYCPNCGAKMRTVTDCHTLEEGER